MTEHQTEDRSTNYKAFMIRMWRDTAASPWRASVQSVLSGEVVRFSTFPALLGFLRSHATSEQAPMEPELYAAAEPSKENDSA